MPVCCSLNRSPPRSAPAPQQQGPPRPCPSPGCLPSKLDELVELRLTLSSTLLSSPSPSNSSSSSSSNPTQGHQHHHLAPSQVYPNLTCLAAASSLSLPACLFACAEQGLPLSPSVPRHPPQGSSSRDFCIGRRLFVLASHLFFPVSQNHRTRAHHLPRRVLCFLELPSTCGHFPSTRGALLWTHACAWRDADR